MQWHLPTAGIKNSRASVDLAKETGVN